MTTNATATTAANTISDLDFATYILANGLAALSRIDGIRHRRVFVFDRTIPPDAVMRYHSSPEKRALDVQRSLKITLTGIPD